LQYHTLGAMDFKHNDRARRMVQLMRTEDKAVMDVHGMKVGDKQAMKRGPLESFSLVQKVTVYGTETTVQDVPHHRIFGLYFWERQPNSGQFFLGDHENEFVAMADGLVAHYTEGKKKSRW
ncbi:MAG: hypothetical protein M3P51_11305, partial [Chloroflexota bacterium]|nr:hypothetical protein [Chloroflexota bacterium]